MYFMLTATEEFILGVVANILKNAGPVTVYGTVICVIYRVICLATKRLDQIGQAFTLILLSEIV